MAKDDDDGRTPGEGGDGRDTPEDGNGPSVGPPSEPWQDRVRFSGAMAYRPHDVLVRSALADSAQRVLTKGRKRPLEQEEDESGTFVRLTVPDPLDAVATLHDAGIVAQVNHVLFATCCCPPHPAGRAPADPSGSGPGAGDVGASPYFANPYFANPYFANAGGGGCCGCGGQVGASPYFANPYFANPYFANAEPSPGMQPPVQLTGRRRSSARPLESVEAVDAAASTATSVGGEVHVAILDTGWAQSFVPDGLPDLLPDANGNGGVIQHGGDHPDGDGDGYLDPAAGHGTFIAGVIERHAPGCTIELFPSLSAYGDGDEWAIAGTLHALARRRGKRPHLVNLSFGGYSPAAMYVLADAVDRLQRRGTVIVASAGNDATCVPMYPAALPGVVGVAALDDEGRAAVFTNYGPWVRACAPGVDVPSLFFDGFDGAESAPAGGADPDRFDGWATWSGTSFAAPRVVAALARSIYEEAPVDRSGTRIIDPKTAAQEAVTRLIDDPDPHDPVLGTKVE